MHHGYIQWLFPIRTKGLNYNSQPLKKHELEVISLIICIPYTLITTVIYLQELKNHKNKQNVRKALIKSFQMMLDFYGMKIKNMKTVELERTKIFKERYKNLIR